MGRKIIFPIKVGNRTFDNHKELYDFYYSVEPDYLTEFGKPFRTECIDLVELVHSPERFTIINGGLIHGVERLQLKENDSLLWTFQIVYDGDGKFRIYANGKESLTVSDCESAPEAMAKYFELWDTDEVTI
jgi:hypothetical protein